MGRGGVRGFAQEHYPAECPVLDGVLVMDGVDEGRGCGLQRQQQHLSPDDKVARYLVYLKYWILDGMPLMVYPKVLSPPNSIILASGLPAGGQPPANQCSRPNSSLAGEEVQMVCIKCYLSSLPVRKCCLEDAPELDNGPFKVNSNPKPY